jgi:hypothetical protein
MVITTRAAAEIGTHSPTVANFYLRWRTGTVDSRQPLNNAHRTGSWQSIPGAYLARDPGKRRVRKKRCCRGGTFCAVPALEVSSAL